MKEEANVPGCGRENDLIAFLYDELDPAERISFRSHVQECLSCSAETAEFTNIRESVVAWPAPFVAVIWSANLALSALIRL